VTDIKEIAVIGGGAAGFFAAINCKINHPNVNVTIYEKSNKLLSKVKISGGGRCNVTNATFSISELAKNYPRGQKELKKVFNVFNTQDTINWFEDRGVELVTQSDLCIFPKSQNSQTIIDCFLSEAKRLDIKIVIQRKLTQLKKVKDLFLLEFNNGEVKINSDSVILTIGGQPKLNGLSFLTEIGHTLAFPVPSLFTFNMPHETITELMGIVVEDVEVKIQSTKLVETGPLLITHWGMSGPSILKLSAWGARILYEKDYKFNVQIKWLKDFNFETLEQHLRAEITKHSNKKIINQKIVPLPSRLWQYLLNRIVFNTQKKWGELSKKEINKLVNVLLNDVYKVEGKTTFKEEFVTCGGVHLNEIDFKTMQSKIVKGLYFAGEVMDVDGITGGFNFQNAWSTAYVASRLN
jgi:hypothetical protein